MKKLIYITDVSMLLSLAARKRMEERFDRRYVWSMLKEFYHKALVEE